MLQRSNPQPIYNLLHIADSKSRASAIQPHTVQLDQALTNQKHATVSICAVLKGIRKEHARASQHITICHCLLLFHNGMQACCIGLWGQLAFVQLAHHHLSAAICHY